MEVKSIVSVIDKAFVFLKVPPSGVGDAMPLSIRKRGASLICGPGALRPLEPLGAALRRC